MHMGETGHTFKKNEAKMIDTANSKSGRLFKEAWYSTKESISRHIDLIQTYMA